MLLRVALIALAALAGCHGDRAPRSSSAAPRRVITLTPSATRLVAALGATDRLVATDRFSRHPAEVERLPKVGDFLAPNVEAIAKLEPDLVVLDAVQAKAAESLAGLGLEVVSIEMHSIEDVKKAVGVVAAALHVPERGEAVRRAIDGALAATRARAAKRRQRPRVLWIMDRQPGNLAGMVAAGPGSFAHELLTAVGARNALSGSVRYPRISRESLIRLAPDVVVDASGPGGHSLQAWKRPGLEPEHPWRLASAPVELATPGPGVAAALQKVEAIVFSAAE